MQSLSPLQTFQRRAQLLRRIIPIPWQEVPRIYFPDGSDRVLFGEKAVEIVTRYCNQLPGDEYSPNAPKWELQPSEDGGKRKRVVDSAR